MYDAYTETLKKKIKQEFNKLQLAGFDELNVIRVTKVTKRIWKQIDRMNRKAYADMCGWVYDWVYMLYGDIPPDMDWVRYVDEYLKGYDPVTRYVYGPELERKRLRLTEGILTVRETQDRQGLEDVLRTAANLLLTQSLQYGLDLIAKVEMQAFEEEGEYVRYNSCGDSRVCEDCEELDGKIFPIDEAPRIPQHYRCRCWYTPAEAPDRNSGDAD